MMYHLKFSFTGGASCSDGCSPLGCCSSGTCSSTAMRMPLGVSMPAASAGSCLVLGKVRDQPRDTLADNEIDDLKIRGEDEHRCDHDDRGRADLFSGGCNDLAHLAPDVAKELLEP